MPKKNADASRLDRYRPNYLQELDLTEDRSESSDESDVENDIGDVGELQPLGISAPSTVNTRVIEADPNFSGFCVMCVAPLGCLYLVYLLWALVLLLSVRSEEDVQKDHCGLGEMWWICFTATFTAWGSLCMRICNPQSAQDMAHFAASGSLGGVSLIRTKLEAGYALLSATGCAAMLGWAINFELKPWDRTCTDYVEESWGSLSNCLIASATLQFLAIWYWFWCGLISAVPALRRTIAVGPASGRVQLTDSVKVKMGPKMGPRRATHGRHQGNSQVSPEYSEVAPSPQQTHM